MCSVVILAVYLFGAQCSGLDKKMMPKNLLFRPIWGMCVQPEKMKNTILARSLEVLGEPDIRRTNATVKLNLCVLGSFLGSFGLSRE